MEVEGGEAGGGGLQVELEVDSGGEGAAAIPLGQKIGTPGSGHCQKHLWTEDCHCQGSSRSPRTSDVLALPGRRKAGR